MLQGMMGEIFLMVKRNSLNILQFKTNIGKDAKMLSEKS